MRQPEPVHPPGPAPRLGGVLGMVGTYARMARDPMRFVGRRFARYGDIYRVTGTDRDLYVLRHPEHLREVLVTHAGRYGKGHTAFERMQRVLGDGLLTTDGETWRRHRRLVQPAFAPDRLAEYAVAMVDEAERTLRGWRPGMHVDVSREMMELTLRVVSRTLFSHDASGDTDAVSHAMTAFQGDLIAPDLLPSWVPSPGRRRLEHAIEALDRIMLGMIAARRQGGEPRPDLLQRLLEAHDAEGEGQGPALTDREVRDHLVTFFLAGHETTSHALGWTWYLLGRHPDVEARLHAELDRVLGGRSPTADDVPALTYTGWVVRESLRLYPPAYITARRALEDTAIGGFPVAAGAEVVGWIWHMHHDPRWWPEPDRFDPSRFHPDEEAKRPRLAWLPFGAGPRTCVGKHFALLEAQLLLATLAQRYRARPTSPRPVRPLPRVTLRPKGGLPMVLEARARAVAASA